jgi:hypothetical protein
VRELESALDVPARVTATSGTRTSDGGAATRGADAPSDVSLSEVVTVPEEAPGGGRHQFVRFPAPANVLHATAPSADEQSALEKGQVPEQEHDAGSAADQCEAVTHPASVPVAGDRSRAVAATPPVSADGPGPSGSLRRRPAVRFILVGLLALALGGTAVAANLLDPVDAMSVVAEPADSSGGDPFTPPPTTGDGTSAPTSPAGGGSALGTDGGAPPVDVRVPGDTGGLYGGTGAEACSSASMARFFDDHADRQWRGPEPRASGPATSRRSSSRLTPVVLRTDTAVTNHGFRDGRANAYQAVLQAGTAVLVDEYGVPRVRCACGNPLDGPGARDQVRYTGETWSELGRRSVTVIEAAPAVVEQFVVLVVQQDTTVVVGRPPGTDGDQDEPATPEAVEAAREFSGEEPATDGSAGTGDQAATDGSAGTGDQAATDGSGEVPATDGSAGTGEQPATDGSAGTGDPAATDGSAGSGDSDFD